jgi:hypothetical protein
LSIKRNFRVFGLPPLEAILATGLAVTSVSASAVPVAGTVAKYEAVLGHMVLDAESQERGHSRFSTYFQHAIMMLI